MYGPETRPEAAARPIGRAIAHTPTAACTAMRCPLRGEVRFSLSTPAGSPGGRYPAPRARIRAVGLSLDKGRQRDRRAGAAVRPVVQRRLAVPAARELARDRQPEPGAR